MPEKESHPRNLTPTAYPQSKRVASRLDHGRPYYPLLTKDRKKKSKFNAKDKMLLMNKLGEFSGVLRVFRRWNS